MRLAVIISMLFLLSCGQQKPAIVFQTDFGVKDGAVAAMKGVAHEVDPFIPLYDLTHEIPAYNIWEASYRLNQTAGFWPKGTVFVSVVDPGVGTARRPVVAKTLTGHYVVTPDNGTLGLILYTLGIDELRLIDTVKNRRKGSEDSHTFHGRDIFAYTAARLASGDISYDEVGPLIKGKPIEIPYQQPEYADDSVRGNIPILDVQYGNVWSNIPADLLTKAKMRFGDSLSVVILHRTQLVFSGSVPYVRTFGDVPEGKMLGYINSLGNFSLAVNMGSFADSFKIKSGADWGMVIGK